MNRKSSNKNIITQPFEVQNAFRLQGVLTPPALGANQNDYSPTGLENSSILRLSTSGGNRIITGILAQPNGTVITLSNINTSNDTIQLTGQSASSLAANRIITGNFNIIMGMDESCTLWYDAISSRWRVISQNI